MVAELDEMDRLELKLKEEYAEAARQVHQQQSRVLANVIKAFGISMNRPSLHILHFILPLDNNYNRLPPDDMNGVLGHVSMLTVHFAKVFDIELPFELVPCRPLTFFKLSAKENLMLYLDPRDTLGRGIAKFVTALGLLNFSLAWLASILLPAELVHQWNGLENLWSILQWQPEYKMKAPKVSLGNVLRETMHCWNLQTGDGVASAVPIDRLERIMHRNLTQLRL